MTSRNGGPLLRATGLSFAYRAMRGQAPSVLHDVTLDVAAGSIVGLLGPNGAGKTTLLRALAGMIVPSTGQILFAGEALGAMSRVDIARRIAVVPQDTHAAFDFSVLDMVLMGRYPHLGRFALEGADDLRIARDALEATGTRHLEIRPFSTLSGGERQRVVIAGALAQGTEALLLDEPTASLDLGYQLEIASLLARINRERGTTIVVSTHDLNLAAAVCSTVVMLKGGRVLAQGATADTLTSIHLRELYDVDTDVQFHPGAGHLTVVPLTRIRQ